MMKLRTLDAAGAFDGMKVQLNGQMLPVSG